MVIVRVHMIAGRTEQQKRELIAALTDVAAETLQVPAEDIRVILVEIGADAWGAGGQTIADLRAAGKR